MFSLLTVDLVLVSVPVQRFGIHCFRTDRRQMHESFPGSVECRYVEKDIYFDCTRTAIMLERQTDNDWQYFRVPSIQQGSNTQQYFRLYLCPISSF